MGRSLLIVSVVVLLTIYAVYWHTIEKTPSEGGEWFLLNLHQHVWDGEEWGGDRVNYTTVFDLMFNGSYFDFDGVLINDELPEKKEIVEYQGYVAEMYPGRLYLVGGHYHIHWHEKELPISLIIPSANASALPREFYKCEKITDMSLEEIASEVHHVGGLLVWDHPFKDLDNMSEGEVNTLMELFDGIEVVSVRGTRGAGSLTKEELAHYWKKIEPYVLEGKVFPAGVTDYSAYLGIPEERGAFWMNKDYGTLVKAFSGNEEAVLQALRDKKAVAILRSKSGELFLYGEPELVGEVRERFQLGTLR
jgi:hypothetical protein